MQAKKLFLRPRGKEVAIIGIDHQLIIPEKVRIVLKLPDPNHPYQETKKICNKHKPYHLLGCHLIYSIHASPLIYFFPTIKRPYNEPNP